MEKKYNKKLELYGESWKTMDLQLLRKRLDDEFKEYDSCFPNTKYEKDELIDVSNICMMLWNRMDNNID